MSVYGSALAVCRKDLQTRNHQEQVLQDLLTKIVDHRTEYVVMTEAQTLLGTLSDLNTEKTLNFITGLINKTLYELFPGRTRVITLKKHFHAGIHPHIKVELVVEGGAKRDLALTTGQGLAQVVSFLFAICLLNIRKGRPVFVMDELLSGVHSEAKKVMEGIIEMFAARIQFVMVEYGVEDIGKMYLVEMVDQVSTVRQIDKRHANHISLSEEEAAA